MDQHRRVRTGTITTAALFIGGGLALLADLNGWWEVPGEVWRWWPLLPLMLGIEILMTQLITGRDTTVVLDGLSLALLIVLVGASVMYQIGGSTVHMSGGIEHKLTVVETVTDLDGVDKVRLENPLGSVEVNPSEDGTVRISAEMIGRGRSTGEAKARAEEMSLQLTSDSLLSVRVLPLGRQNQICNLVVHVPAELLLEVENKFGHVKVVDRQADLLIRSGFGSVTSRNIEGNLQIENEMGSVDVNQVAGDLTIRNSHGRVSASNVAGELDVSNSFATVDIDSVAGLVAVRNQNGPIDAEELKQGGTLATTFAPITARSINSNINCRSQNGPIELRDINGEIEAITSFATIQLDEFNGAVKAINQNGRIVLDTSKSLTGPLELRSSFGSIVLRVPQSSSLEIDAETTFASISGKDLTISKQGNTTTASGRIGGGGAKALLRTSHGSIDITLR